MQTQKGCIANTTNNKSIYFNPILTIFFIFKTFPKDGGKPYIKPYQIIHVIPMNEF